MKSIYIYSDFRRYLKDFLADRKARGLSASNRWFAAKAGINSSSWLTLLLQGKRSLSQETAQKVSEVCGHTPDQKQYFKTLVAFNQEKKLNRRNDLYNSLLKMRKNNKIQFVVGSDQYEFYTHWYHSAVRSLIGVFSFKEDEYDRIASMIVPAITPGQAKKSIQLLKRLCMIKNDEQNILRLTADAITTGSYEKSLAITNFQQETLRLAAESFDRFEQSARDNSTLTIGISADCYKKIRNILAQTRKTIVEMVENDTDTECVYQLNMQLFPLSRITENGGKK
ncbi:MAG: TIGR02147 family protein [Fibrobacter sp.]|nr:TIGR02147 family protein [Fibrobacter sp.]